MPCGRGSADSGRVVIEGWEFTGCQAHATRSVKTLSDSAALRSCRGCERLTGLRAGVRGPGESTALPPPTEAGTTHRHDPTPDRRQQQRRGIADSRSLPSVAARRVPAPAGPANDARGAPSGARYRGSSLAGPRGGPHRSCLDDVDVAVGIPAAMVEHRWLEVGVDAMHALHGLVRIPPRVDPLV